VAPLASSGSPAARIPIGLQLYSVRDELNRDQVATLRGIGKMGYDGVALIERRHRVPFRFGSIAAESFPHRSRGPITRCRLVFPLLQRYIHSLGSRTGARPASGRNGQRENTASRSEICSLLRRLMISTTWRYGSPEASAEPFQAT
jgi:hypothetical protein